MFDVTTRADMNLVASLIHETYTAAGRGGPLPPVVSGLAGARYVIGELVGGPVSAWLAFIRDGQLVILLTGASTLTHGLAIYQGACLPKVQLGIPSVNLVLGALAQRVLKTVLAAIGALPSSIVCAGHSYGGGVAHVVAGLIAQQGTAAQLQLFTCAAPRAGDDALAQLLASVTAVRLMTPGDPIPRFPPHFEEAPVITVGSGWPAAQFLSTYAQGPGGRLIDQVGTMTPAELPPQPLPIGDATMAIWLGSLTANQITEHSLPTYIDRIGSEVLQLGRAVPTIGASLKGELAIPLPQDIFALGPVAGPAAFQEYLTVAGESVYLPPEFRFKAQKVGKVFSVVWIDQVVMKCGTFSKAKTIAKAGNKFLRVIQNTQEILATPLGQSLSDYLVQAASAGAGFQPVANVTY